MLVEGNARDANTYNNYNYKVKNRRNNIVYKQQYKKQYRNNTENNTNNSQQ